MANFILVAGVHRSGTSMCARILNEIGFNISQDLLGSNSSNIYGHYECKKLIAANESLNKHNNITWQDVDEKKLDFIETENLKVLKKFYKKYHDNDTFILKDPRSNIYLDHLSNYMNISNFIICFRKPIDYLYSILFRHANNIYENKPSIKYDNKFFDGSRLAEKIYNYHNEHILNFVKKNKFKKFYFIEYNNSENTKIYNKLKLDFELENKQKINFENLVDQRLGKKKNNFKLFFSNYDLKKMQSYYDNLLSYYENQIV